MKSFKNLLTIHQLREIPLEVLPESLRTRIILPHVSRIAVEYQKQPREYNQLFYFLKKYGPSIRHYNPQVQVTRKIDPKYPPIPSVKVFGKKNQQETLLAELQANNFETAQQLLEEILKVANIEEEPQRMYELQCISCCLAIRNQRFKGSQICKQFNKYRGLALKIKSLCRLTISVWNSPLASKKWSSRVVVSLPLQPQDTQSVAYNNLVKRVIQMLIPLTDLQLIYNKVLEQLNVAYTSVLIFVAFDTDAVCTLKILTGILKSQNILYEVYPVASYLQLEEKIESTRSMDKIKMIFFINCGGGIDLTMKWFYTERADQQITLFLLDVHKPIHHANIAHRNIKVVNDGHSNFEKCPTYKDINKLEELEEQQIASQQQLENLEYHSQPVENAEEDEVSPLKRKREIKKRLQAEKKQLKIEINKKIEEYYSKQYSSFPSSLLAFRFARDINKTSNEYLWLGMVGLTSLFLESKLSKDVYDKAQNFFSSEMMKLNFSALKNGDNVGSIYREVDFRFTLLRHWSLYESMKYSPYMVMKMRLWDDNGLNRMHDFITQIGVSLEQAKQLYTFMPTRLYNDIKGELFKKAEEFQLLDIFFNSFRRQIDTYESFACSDYCSAITAALEESNPPGITTQKAYQLRRQNFWTAYHMLEQGRIQDLKHFIENYKTFMKILVTEALGILEKSQINPCLEFLYVKFINNTPEKQLFQHPFRLVKLGQLVMGLYHEKKRSKTRSVKPLVISIQSHDNPICMVAGVVPDVQNPFGNKFIQVAEKNNFERRHDGFLGNIIQIKKQDLVKFIGELNLT